jgi:hypothetical protein
MNLNDSISTSTGIWSHSGIKCPNCGGTVTNVPDSKID